MKHLSLEQYNYNVPEHLVAQKPTQNREDSKLLLYKKHTQEVQNFSFNNLCDLLPSGALLVLNDTKVFKARVIARKQSGAKIEIFILNIKDTTKGCCQAETLIKGASKIKEKDTLILDDKLFATISKKQRITTVAINKSKKELLLWLEKNAQIPLPPYIKRKDSIEDEKRYQTVYGKHTGSVAAPTSGLHFTPKILAQLKEKGIRIETITLHVGLGTFKPVEASSIDKHVMHEEFYKIEQRTYDSITTNMQNSKPIIAVGTTTLRCLESFHLLQQKKSFCDVLGKWQSTDLFIYPSANPHEYYKPWALSGMITNFHQPKSSLFMLICALLGTKETKTLYKKALVDNYRLFSYGDACLLWF
jgi:S-adenosylmethionine:tRNA ribosyltransferase-isomerase